MKIICWVCTMLVLAGLLEATAQVSFAPPVNYNVGHYPVSIIAADVNGDGKVDLISANELDNTLSVLTNNGTGGFVLASSLTVGKRPQWVTAADVNGDGKLDLISANAGTNTLSVLTNDGMGGFVLATTLTVGNAPWCVVAADVTGDGRLDLISANMDGSFSVLLNNGGGNFAPPATYEVGNGVDSVTAADLSGNGNMDLICACWDTYQLVVFTNNGSGVFASNATLAVGFDPYSVTAADVSKDGNMDLICANAGPNTLSVLRNNGSGGFAAASSLSVGSEPVSVVAADVNGHGVLDLICANFSSDTLSLLTNNGSGGFTLANTMVVGAGPWSVTAADVNGDGNMDLICANSGNNTLSVLLNNNGSLQVTLSPAEAVNAGSQWQVDGGAWESSGATVAGLTAGSHTVTFNSVGGWKSPGSIAATINASQITKVSALYTGLSSLAGNSFGIGVTGGAYPFASSGYFLFLPASTGSNYQVIGIYNVTNSSGTYSYWTNGTDGTVYFNDSVAGSIVGNLSYSNAFTGSYFVTNAAFEAYQQGNFEDFSGQVPTSIAGKIVECTVLAGLYPLANTGTFSIKIANSANTYTVVGDGTNTANSSGNYSYSEINGTTGAMQISDSLSGSSTVYLAYSNSNEGGFAVKSLSTGGFQIGHFVTTDTGSLQVAIAPTAAVSAGAEWQVGGGPFQSSGTTVGGLIVGSHTISFNTITGWETPSNQTVTLSDNSAIMASATYFPIDSLQVSIVPSGAIAAGAQWQVDGGTLQNSGATVSNLLVGNHTVNFNTVDGWETPSNQSVSITANSAAKIGGTYTQELGSVKVDISPASAITAGARWQVDGGMSHNSGTAVTNLAVGSHVVSFKTISGWIAPTNETVVVSNKTTSIATGNYIATGSLQVSLSPAAAIAGGAQWAVDFGALMKSGATVTNLPVSNYTVSFKGINYWTGPPSETVVIKGSTTTKVTGNYTFNGAGIYNGLFAHGETNVVSSGMLSGLAVTASGTYSGKLLIGDSTNAISGSFNDSGMATNSIARTGKLGGPLTLEMQVNWNNSPLTIGGTVSGTNGGEWVANLTAELAASGKASAEYTAWLSPDGTPPGYGYILMTNHAGTVTLPVTLADGTSFSQTVPLSGNGDLPVYGNLYGSTGLLLGWINMESGSPTGDLTWIKPASRATAFYTNGFTNVVGVQGSRWTNPLPNTAAIDLPSGQLVISNGTLPPNLTFNVAVSNENNATLDTLVKLTKLPTNSLSGSINRKTGLLTVTFGYGVKATTTTGTGAVLQNVTNAAGFFLGKTNAGSIILQP